MNKKDVITIIKFSLIAILIILIVGVLDYNNTFGNITMKLNFDFLNIFINALVIVFMFIITYLLIERKTFDNEEKIEKNKRGMLLLLLEKVCDECLSQIKMLDEQEMVEKYLIPKINFNSTDNIIIENIKSKPFEYENRIINLFSDGILDKKYFKNYMNIKDCFESYVQWRITLFDAKKSGRSDLVELVSSKKTEILNAVKKQQKEMEKLEENK